MLNSWPSAGFGACTWLQNMYFLCTYVFAANCNVCVSEYTQMYPSMHGFISRMYTVEPLLMIPNVKGHCTF